MIESTDISAIHNFLQVVVSWEKKQVRRWNAQILKSRFLGMIKAISFVFGPWSLLWMGVLITLGCAFAHHFVLIAAYGGALLEAWLLFMLFKALIHRQRPYLDDDSIKPLDSQIGKYGFPSGHTYFFIVIWLFLLVEFHWPSWTLIPIFTMGLFIAYTRIALGVHYPMDTYLGLALGVIIMVLFRQVTGIPLTTFYIHIFS